MKAQKRTFSSNKGKNRLFSNAIQKVHVGVAHQLLSSASSVTYLSTRLVGTAHTDLPAFRVELDELATQHVTSIFRAFHREVSPLCETKALMTAYLPTIVDLLLTYMENAAKVLVGSGGGGENSAANNNNNNHKINTTSQNSISNEFLVLKPFLTMTVALFREYAGHQNNNNNNDNSSPPRLLPLLDAFVAVAYRCLFDSSGFIIPDADRIQAIFLTQASWLRDAVLPAVVIVDPAIDQQQQQQQQQQTEEENNNENSDDDDDAKSNQDDEDEKTSKNIQRQQERLTLLRRVIFMYCREMVNSKNPQYVRRLTMEALSTIFRKVPQDSLNVLAEFILSNNNNNNNQNFSSSTSSGGYYYHQIAISMMNASKKSSTKNNNNNNNNNGMNKMNFTTEAIQYGLGCLFSELLSGLAGALHTRHCEFIEMIVSSFKMLETDDDDENQNISSSPFNFSASKILQFVGFNGLVESAEKVVFDLTKAKTPSEFFSTVLQILESLASISSKNKNDNDNNTNTIISSSSSSSSTTPIMMQRLLLKFIGARHGKMLSGGIVTADDFSYSASEKKLPLLNFFEEKLFPRVLDQLSQRQNHNLSTATLITETLSLVAELLTEKTVQHVYVDSFCSHLLSPLVESLLASCSSSTSTLVLTNLLLPFIADVVSRCRSFTGNHLFTFDSFSRVVRSVLTFSIAAASSADETSQNNNNTNQQQQQLLRLRLLETFRVCMTVNEGYLSSILVSDEDWKTQTTKKSGNKNTSSKSKVAGARRSRGGGGGGENDNDEDSNNNNAEETQTRASFLGTEIAKFFVSSSSSSSSNEIKQEQEEESSLLLLQTFLDQLFQHEESEVDEQQFKTPKTATSHSSSILPRWAQQQLSQAMIPLLSQLFSTFYDAKKDTTSSVVNLSIVWNIVRIHGKFFASHQQQQQQQQERSTSTLHALPDQKTMKKVLHLLLHNIVAEQKQTSSGSLQLSSSSALLESFCSSSTTSGETTTTTAANLSLLSSAASVGSDGGDSTYARDLLRLIITSLSAKEQRTRILSLRLLLRLFEQEDTRKLLSLISSMYYGQSDDAAASSSPSSASAVPRNEAELTHMKQYAIKSITSLLRAETADPFAEGQIDVKKIAVAQLSFDAAAGRLPYLLRVIFARSAIGLFFVRFADLWPEAQRILRGSLLVEDVSQNNNNSSSINSGVVWNEVSSCMEHLLFPDFSAFDDDEEEGGEDENEQKINKKNDDSDDENNNDDDGNDDDEVPDDEDAIDQLLQQAQTDDEEANSKNNTSGKSSVNSKKNSPFAACYYPTPFLLQLPSNINNNNMNNKHYLSLFSKLLKQVRNDTGNGENEMDNNNNNNNNSENQQNDPSQLIKGSTDSNTLMTTMCKFIATSTSSAEKQNKTAANHEDDARQHHQGKNSSSNNNDDHNDNNNDDNDDSSFTTTSVIRPSIEQWAMKSIISLLGRNSNNNTHNNTSTALNQISSVSVTLSKLEARRVHALMLACAAFAQTHQLSRASAEFLRQKVPSLLLCNDIDAQRAALTLLRRLKVKPFDSAFDYLAPLVTLSHQKGSKLALPHLQTLDVQSLNYDIRSSVVANMVLLMLPKMNIGSIAVAGSSASSSAAAAQQQQQSSTTAVSASTQQGRGRRDKAGNRDSTAVVRVLRIFGNLTEAEEADAVVSFVLEHIILGHLQAGDSASAFEQKQKQQAKVGVSYKKSTFASSFDKIREIVDQVIPWNFTAVTNNNNSNNTATSVSLKKSQARRLAMALSVLHEFMSVQLSHKFAKWGGFAFELALRCWKVCKTHTSSSNNNNNNNNANNKFLKALVVQCENAISNAIFNYPERAVEVLLMQQQNGNNQNITSSLPQLEIFTSIFAQAREQLLAKINGMSAALLSSPLLSLKGTSELSTSSIQQQQQDAAILTTSNNNNNSGGKKGSQHPLGLILLSAIFRPNLAHVFAPLIEVFLKPANNNNTNSSMVIPSLISVALSAPLKLMERLRSTKEKLIASSSSSGNNNNSNVGLLVDATLSTNYSLLQRVTGIVVEISTVGLDCLSSLLEFRKEPTEMQCFFTHRHLTENDSDDADDDNNNSNDDDDDDDDQLLEIDNNNKNKYVVSKQVQTSIQQHLYFTPSSSLAVGELFASMLHLAIRSGETSSGSVGSGGLMNLKLPMDLWPRLVHCVSAFTELFTSATATANSSEQNKQQQQKQQQQPQKFSLLKQNKQIVALLPELFTASIKICSLRSVLNQSNNAGSMLESALQTLHDLSFIVQDVDFNRHYVPLCNLFNLIHHPVLRLRLCDILPRVGQMALGKIKKQQQQLEQNEKETRGDNNNNNDEGGDDDNTAKFIASFDEIFATMGAFIAAMNSFTDDSYHGYDFDMRYFCFHSISQQLGHVFDLHQKVLKKTNQKEKRGGGKRVEEIMTKVGDDDGEKKNNNDNDDNNDDENDDDKEEAEEETNENNDSSEIIPSTTTTMKKIHLRKQQKPTSSSSSLRGSNNIVSSFESTHERAERNYGCDASFLTSCTFFGNDRKKSRVISEDTTTSSSDAATMTKDQKATAAASSSHHLLARSLNQVSSSTSPEWVLVLLPVITNILFFLRDKEQSIRLAASESLTSFLKLGKFVDADISYFFAAQQQQEEQKQHQQQQAKEQEKEDEEGKINGDLDLPNEDGDIDAEQPPPLLASVNAKKPLLTFDYLLRNFVMPSMRHNIVAADPAIRSTCVELWGVLPRFMPKTFHSLVPLLGGAGVNSSIEQSFFATVTAGQHKLRLRGLGILRKQCKHVAVRDLLRTFIPFLMCCMKDIAQGKERSNSSNNNSNYQNRDSAAASAGVTSQTNNNNNASDDSKYSADSITQTLAAVTSVLPWEGYSSVLKKMIKTATDEEALRPAMLKAVTRVLDAFSFLPNLNTLNFGEDDEDEETAADASGAAGAGASGRGRRRGNKNKKGGNKNADQIFSSFKEFMQKHDSLYNSRQKRILREIHTTLLPDLLKFVVSAVKKGGKNLNNLSNDPRLAVLGKNAVSTSLNRSSPATQMQVAVAVVKLLRFVPGGFDAHAEPLLNEIILRLRTKRDDIRDTARSILCATMKEVGVTKLPFLLRTFKDCFVHGYQKHVLSYTIAAVLSTLRSEFVVVEAKKNHAKVKRNIAILDKMLNELLTLFIDDFLGELSEQKEQAELASSIPEIKNSKGLSGCVFLAEHASCELVLRTVALQIRFILDPTNARQMSVNNMLTTNPVENNKGRSKQVRADFRYVKKVRDLSVHLAIALSKNSNVPSERLLAFAENNLKANSAARDEKIKRFESKDGFRRIRGGTQNVHQPAKKLTHSDQLKSTFEIVSRPERIDVDMVTNTVLGTGSSEQSKKKKQGLRNMQRGRIMKKLNANDGGDDEGGDFKAVLSLEDPATAQLLDVMDELALRVTLLVTRRFFRREQTSGNELTVEQESVKNKKSNKKKQKKGDDDDDDDDESDGSDDDEEENEDDEIDQEQEEENTEEKIQKENVRAENLVDEVIEQLVDSDNNNNDNNNSNAKNTNKNNNPSPHQQRPRLAQQQQPKNAALMITTAVTISERASLDKIVEPAIASLQGEGADVVVTCALDVLHTMLALQNPMLPTLSKLSGDLLQVLLTLARRGGIVRDRCLRSIAAIVANKAFKLSNEVAQKLLLSIRTEVLDRTASLNSALTVLTTVIAKKPQIPEIYEIVTPITDLMMNYALGRKALRARCIVVLTRFLTEMPMTKEKFRSHVDLYLKSMRTYPDIGGRIALCELLEALVYRLPTPVLLEEAMVFFIPLVEVAARNEAGFELLQHKAAAVLVSLMTNAGLHVFAPAIQEWCKKKDSKKVRETGIQLLPLYTTAAVAVSQYWFADSLHVLKIVEERANLRQNAKNNKFFSASSSTSKTNNNNKNNNSETFVNLDGSVVVRRSRADILKRRQEKEKEEASNNIDDDDNDQKLDQDKQNFKNKKNTDKKNTDEKEQEQENENEEQDEHDEIHEEEEDDMQQQQEQEQVEEEEEQCVSVAWSVLEWVSNIIHETLSEFSADDQFGSKTRAQITQQHKQTAESSSWTMVYHCLRCIEIISVQFAPELAHHFFNDLRDSILPVYLHHSQPWVRSVAMRLGTKYLTSPVIFSNANNFVFITPSKALSLCNRLIDNIQKLNVDEIKAAQHISRIVQVLDYRGDASDLRELIVAMFGFACCNNNNNNNNNLLTTSSTSTSFDEDVRRAINIVQHLRESISAVTYTGTIVDHSIQTILVLQIFNRIRHVAETKLFGADLLKKLKGEDQEAETAASLRPLGAAKANNNNNNSTTGTVSKHHQQQRLSSSSLSSEFEKFTRFFAICASPDSGKHFSRIPEISKGIASIVAHKSLFPQLASAFATLHVRAHERKTAAALRNDAVRDVRAARQQNRQQENGGGRRTGGPPSSSFKSSQSHKFRSESARPELIQQSQQRQAARRTSSSGNTGNMLKKAGSGMMRTSGNRRSRS